MGSILKVTADGFDTSPILRGAWIAKNIVGNTLSPPPENIVAIEPDHSNNRNIKFKGKKLGTDFFQRRSFIFKNNYNLLNMSRCF